MSPIDRHFEALGAQGQAAFIPFITAGDPDLAFTCDALRLLADCGCHLCEVGFPYSDPIADGPVIQASYARAVAGGTRVADIFDAVTTLSRDIHMPLIAMVSYSIVLRAGVVEFVERAWRAGFAGAIVPDLPLEEAGELTEACRRRELSLIQLVAPTTPAERALRIARNSSGFVYYVSVTGITGQRDELPRELVDRVSWLRGQIELPVCVGFGISRPDQVRQVASVADGIIVGSALVRCLASASGAGRANALAQLRELVSQLLTALNTDKA